MPQPKPSTPNIKPFIGLFLTALGIISVLLLLGGFACHMTGVLGETDLEVESQCTNMMSIGFLGIVGVIILRALTSLIPK